MRDNKFIESERVYYCITWLLPIPAQYPVRCLDQDIVEDRACGGEARCCLRAEYERTKGKGLRELTTTRTERKVIEGRGGGSATNVRHSVQRRFNGGCWLGGVGA